MSKSLSAKYYQGNKERLLKKLTKNIKIFLKKKKKKSSNIVVNVTKISQKMKNKSLLTIEKNIIEREKTLYHNYKALLLYMEKYIFFLFSGFASYLLKYKKLF